MKRVIRFRGKDSAGEWWYGSLAYFPDSQSAHIIPCGSCKNGEVVCDFIEVIPETVEQFIGIRDKNGKEIYDGDIITVRGKYPRIVLWDKMMWALMPTIYCHDEDFWVMNLQHPGVDWWEEYSDEIEVIGNIHDNPELLKNRI